MEDGIFTMRIRSIFLGLIAGLTSLLIYLVSSPGMMANGKFCNSLEEKGNIQKSVEQPTCRDNCLPKIAFQRRLAAVVADVQREIHRLAGQNAVIDAEWSMKLAAVAEELDPRINLVVKSSWDYSALLPNMNSQVKLLNRTRHVCPEVYFTPTINPYGQIGMTPENCDYVPVLSSVLTAVLTATSWASDSVNFVIRQIRKSYDIPIIAIVFSDEKIDQKVTGLTVKKVEESVYEDEGQFMNELFKEIKTPYVLIANSLAHFNNQSSLERLVRVLDELEHVKVAGGAARDLKGHWIHGCLQQRMANYQARYTMGYIHSKYECMYCDDMLTPFVTTKEFISKVPFTKGLSGSVLYRDWFANVRVNGHLTMVCPDVMFYVSTHSAMVKEQWLILAKKWSLEKITSYDGNQYIFDCSSVDIKCSHPLNIIKSYLLPPCCKAMMTKYLGYLTDYGTKNELSYELQAGSAIGALKMDSYLPWDYDHDLIFMCKDYEAWMKAKEEWKRKGCNTVVSKPDIYITVNCPNFFLELYCKEYNATSQQFLPPEYQDTPTAINYSGKYVVVSANPGLHARNRYGLDVLKHVAHWRTVKEKVFGKIKDGDDDQGLWNRCENPKHHSCLDHYPVDGNLPFQEPFLQI